LALAWDDIDLRKKTLTIRKSLSQTKAGFIVKEPKTAAGRRTITLPDVTVTVLMEHKAEMMRAGLLAAPVFCTRTGNYLCKKNVLRAFRNLVNKINRLHADEAKKNEAEQKEAIPAKVRFHDLRHTVASLLLSKGKSLRAVSQRLGHSNPAMTLRVYAHCLPNDDAELATGLNQLLA